MEFEKIVEKYRENYFNLFKEYYPARGNAGIMEANQTYNFISAVKQVYPNAVACLEVPIENEKKEYRNYIDAAIFITDLKIMLLVESKRISTPAEKFRSMGRDINRVISTSSVKSVMDYLVDGDIYMPYIVVLADVWTSDKKAAKTKIYEDWQDDLCKQSKYYEYLGIESSTKKVLQNKHFYRESFSSTDIPLRNKHEEIKWLDSYKLLIFTAKLCFHQAS